MKEKGGWQKEYLVSKIESDKMPKLRNAASLSQHKGWDDWYKEKISRTCTGRYVLGIYAVFSQKMNREMTGSALSYT